MPSSPASSTSSTDLKQGNSDLVRFISPSSTPNISSRIEGGRRAVHSRRQSGEYGYPPGSPLPDQTTANVSLPDGEWQKKQLMAEAVRQRKYFALKGDPEWL